MNKRAIIVGAGIGGLSAAAHLASAGLSVTVLEKSDSVGGKAGIRRDRGFRWDTGPTLLTMPEAIDPILAKADMNLRRDVGLFPLDPLCRYRFASGASFDHRVDPEATARGIATFAPEDALRWPAFVRRAASVYRTVGEPYFQSPFTGLIDYAYRSTSKDPSGLLKAMPLGSLDSLARKWFRAPEMHQFVGRFATYSGASPAEASSAYAMIAHLEGRGDASYPHGGVHAVAQALARAAEKLSAKILLGHVVHRVRRVDHRWRVESSIGNTEADILVLNVDPRYAGRLFFADNDRLTHSLNANAGSQRSLSATVFLFGLRGRTPGLAVHNVFFPSDYRAEFRDIMSRRSSPSDGTVYVSSPSLVDEDAAPNGSESLFVLVNAPAREEAVAGSEMAALRAHVVGVLTKLDPRFESRILVESSLNSADFAKTGSLDGAIYGDAPHGMWAPFVRPPQRVRDARGLYLVGGATHPGGGVPMAALSGQHAANLILDDFQMGSRARASGFA